MNRMTHHENLQIIAFVGDPTQVSAIIDHLTEKGYPKVSADDMVSQIEHLSLAGQHRIVTGDLHDFALYEEVRHDFAGHFTLVGVTQKENIQKFQEAQNETPENWAALEKADHPALLPLAHHYIETNENSAAAADALFEKLGFTL
jgi:hypothetical protein